MCRGDPPTEGSRPHQGALGELEREREQRNYFQLERDKINTLWEISKTELEERKAELRNNDRCAGRLCAVQCGAALVATPPCRATQ